MMQLVKKKQTVMFWFLMYFVFILKSFYANHNLLMNLYKTP